ncbi:MAG: IMP dehydrogenase, partial [Brevibacterium aurantiacum]
MGIPEQETQAANDPFSLTGLTYDDVLLLPGDTDVIPSDASTTTRLTKEIELN